MASDFGAQPLLAAFDIHHKSKFCLASQLEPQVSTDEVNEASQEAVMEDTEQKAASEVLQRLIQVRETGSSLWTDVRVLKGLQGLAGEAEFSNLSLRGLSRPGPASTASKDDPLSWGLLMTRAEVDLACLVLGWVSPQEEACLRPRLLRPVRLENLRPEMTRQFEVSSAPFQSHLSIPNWARLNLRLRLTSSLDASL